ncbi:hypothetical protein KAI10_06800 [Candidatus Bathyarchaeota archaeon]|nr:hypothetical protein [Candidatus Bathyarchaeota archaeon]
MIGGLMDQALLEIVATGTKAAVDRLESWGVQFKYDKVYLWNIQYDASEGEKKYRIVLQFQVVHLNLPIWMRPVGKRVK